MSRLLPIVFDDKALSGVFILFILPAYLQLAPLLNRECCGLPPVKQYHGTLTPPRIALSRPFKEETEVSLYPTSPSSQAAAPHGCLVSLLIARSCMGGHGGRRQVASRKEERSAALTIQFSRNREAAIKPLQNTTDIFHQFLGVSLKNIFAFF